MNHTPLNYALFLLGKRDRSTGEIKQKMREKKLSQEEIEATVKILIEKKFLDDRKFAKHFVRNQISIKPIGKYQLEQKLKQKYISEEIIEETLGDISNEDEIGLAKIAAEKWLRSKYQVLSIKYQGDDRKIKENLSRHLISRGFNWDIVKEIINNLKFKI